MADKKQIFVWSMYDFANTIFSALFISVYFPLFVILIGGNAFHVGLAISISMLLAGLFVPLFGAVADITRRKKLLLFIFTLMSCIFTFFIGFFGLIIALIFGLLANFFYHAGLDVYNSLLVNISNKKNIGRISGIGVAAGYAGTIPSIILAYIIGFIYGFESIIGIKTIFILTALLFFGFSLVFFLLFKEPSKVRIKRHHFKEAFKRVIFTIKNIKKFKYTWIFLLASFLYLDAANTAIIFLYLYARDQIGLQLVEFLPVYLVMAVAAALGALTFGKLTDKIGHKKTLIIILVSWIVIIFVLYLKTTFLTFLLSGSLGGALLGALWTTTRPILIDLTPKHKIAELFGYQGLTDKFSGVLGPVLFGYIAVRFGFNQALLVIITFFLLGLFVLSFVKTKNKH